MVYQGGFSSTHITNRVDLHFIKRRENADNAWTPVPVIDHSEIHLYSPFNIRLIRG